MKRSKNDLTKEELKKIINYNPSTGVFTRLKSGCGVLVGDVTGTKNKSGYLQIGVGKFVYLAHRLAFLYIEGVWPKAQVDHINRVRDDNRWCNIRHSTSYENNRNHANNVKTLGVYRIPSTGNWQVKSPSINGIPQYIGTYQTEFDAICARKSWETSH